MPNTKETIRNNLANAFLKYGGCSRVWGHLGLMARAKSLSWPLPKKNRPDELKSRRRPAEAVSTFQALLLVALLFVPLGQRQGNLDSDFLKAQGL